MGMKIRKTDDKLLKIMSVVAEGADQVVLAAQEAQEFIQRIDTAITTINDDLAAERTVDDEAAAKFQSDILPLKARLANRILRASRNLKALTSLMAAVRALTDEDDQ